MSRSISTHVARHSLMYMCIQVQSCVCHTHICTCVQIMPVNTHACTNKHICTCKPNSVPISQYITCSSTQALPHDLPTTYTHMYTHMCACVQVMPVNTHAQPYSVPISCSCTCSSTHALPHDLPTTHTHVHMYAGDACEHMCTAYSAPVSGSYTCSSTHVLPHDLPTATVLCIHTVCSLNTGLGVRTTFKIQAFGQLTESILGDDRENTIVVRAWKRSECHVP